MGFGPEAKPGYPTAGALRHGRLRRQRWDFPGGIRDVDGKALQMNQNTSMFCGASNELLRKVHWG